MSRSLADPRVLWLLGSLALGAFAAWQVGGPTLSGTLPLLPAAPAEPINAVWGVP